MAKLTDLCLHSVVTAEPLLDARLMGILVALLISLLACSLENLKMQVKTLISCHQMEGLKPAGAPLEG